MDPVEANRMENIKDKRGLNESVANMTLEEFAKLPISKQLEIELMLHPLAEEDEINKDDNGNPILQFIKRYEIREAFYLVNGSAVRIVHEFNKYGWAILRFRFEATEEMVSKLNKAYEGKTRYDPIDHQPIKKTYIDKGVDFYTDTGHGFRIVTAHLYLNYNIKGNYIEVGIEEYPAEKDIGAVSTIKEIIAAIEKL